MTARVKRWLVGSALLLISATIAPPRAGEPAPDFRLLDQSHDDIQRRLYSSAFSKIPCSNVSAQAFVGMPGVVGLIRPARARRDSTAERRL